MTIQKVACLGTPLRGFCRLRSVRGFLCGLVTRGYSCSDALRPGVRKFVNVNTGMGTADCADGPALAKGMALTQWVSRSPERKTAQVLPSAPIRDIRGHSHCRIWSERWAWPAATLGLSVPECRIGRFGNPIVVMRSRLGDRVQSTSTETLAAGSVDVDQLVRQQHDLRVALPSVERPGTLRGE